MPGQSNNKKAAPARAASKSTYGLGLTTKSFELELPSGNTCLASRPGAQGLIKAGLLDSLDQLTGLVQMEYIDAADPKQLQESVRALQLNKDQLQEGLEMVDRAIAFIVVQPRAYLDEQEVDEKTGKPVFATSVNSKGEQVQVPVYKPRVPDRIYADEVDLEDKMFIFNWALGGTADLKSFREESASLLGNLSAS